MKYIKKFFNPLLFTITFLIISIFILTILNYSNILNYSLTRYLKFILAIISLIIGGIKIGNRSYKNKWLEGTKFGFIIILFMIIISLIINKFYYKNLIYYFILLISSTIGGMISKGKNKETN